MFKKNINNAFTVLFISFVCICVEGNVLTEDFAPCPEFCPALFSPVCATNGNGYKEFGNECVLQSANCHLRRSALKAFIKTDVDWCLTEYVENLNSIVGNLDFDRPECVKPCTFLYEPICVSNGKYRTTASSQCILDMFNCALKFNDSSSLFKVLKAGEC